MGSRHWYYYIDTEATLGFMIHIISIGLQRLLHT